MLDKSRIDNLEQVDPDRYRAAGFAPPSERDKLFVFYVFHAELAKIPELVSEPMIGAIRYQWWRDALDEIYSGQPVRQHDIAVPLKAIIDELKIGRFELDSLINGRERDLDPTPFVDMADVLEYCRDTSGRIMQTAVSIISPNTNSDHYCELGTCWGLLGLARSWRFYHNSMLGNISWPELLLEIQTRYNQARAEIGKIDAEITPAIAYAGLIPGYLKTMSKPSYDPLNQGPNYSQLAKKARLLRVALSGKI